MTRTAIEVMDSEDALDFDIRPASRLSQKLQHLGFFSDRLMWWCNTEPRNFGDMIGPMLFYRRNGKRAVLAPVYMRPNRAAVKIAAGSILGSISVPDVAVVWGAGIMRKDTKFAAPREIYAVRGPLSAERCRTQGYACPDVYGDPGILLPRFLPVQKGSDYSLGVIPHYVDRQYARNLFGANSEVLVIDVTKPVEQVAADIQRCSVLVSSSLHGVIVSHAFGRACAWIEFSKNLAGDGTKFADYFLASGVSEPPVAVRVDSETSQIELERLASVSPLPDLSRLADDLLDVCPF